METYKNLVPHPGEYIKEEMDARGWNQRDLSFVLGCSEQSINLLIRGKKGISPEMAKALGDAFGVSFELFINLQNSYEASRAKDPDPSVAERGRLQSIYPIREMIKRGWIDDLESDLLRVQIARFFEVQNISEVPYMPHAAKKTEYDDATPIQLAWLFRVKQIAKSITISKYSDKKLKAALEQLKALLTDPEEMRHVPRILMECGVKFILVEALPNGKIDGVCFWQDGSPVIGMSIRYDRIDNFWFVLRHEIEHVLCEHGKEQCIIDFELEGKKAGYDSSVSNEEQIANKAASNFCIPISEIDDFITRKSPDFSERDVLNFSRRVGVHPGIAVGLIQFKTGKYNIFRNYLIKIRQHILPTSIVDGWGYNITIDL